MSTRARVPAFMPRLQAAWNARAPRERRLLGLAATVVLLALVWAVAIQPALRTLRTAPTQLQALEGDLGRMQALHMRAQTLQALPARDAAVALEQFHSTTTQLLGSSAQSTQAGSLLRVQLSKVDADDLARWLTAVGSAAGLRPASADLRRVPADGAASAAAAVQWSGTITFNLPA